MSNDITPKPKFHGQEVRDETTIRRPTHQGCLIHTKELEKHAPVREPSTPRTIVPRGRGSVLMMVYQEKIVPPGSLPVLASEPPDVLLSQRTWPWMLVWIAAVAVIFGLIGAPLIHLIH